MLVYHEQVVDHFPMKKKAVDHRQEEDPQKVVADHHWQEEDPQTVVVVVDFLKND